MGWCRIYIIKSGDTKQCYPSPLIQAWTHLRPTWGPTYNHLLSPLPLQVAKVFRVGLQGFTAKQPLQEAVACQASGIKSSFRASDWETTRHIQNRGQSEKALEHCITLGRQCYIQLTEAEKLLSTFSPEITQKGPCSETRHILRHDVGFGSSYTAVVSSFSCLELEG